jgi:hypothetical protein
MLMVRYISSFVSTTLEKPVEYITNKSLYIYNVLHVTFEWFILRGKGACSYRMLVRDFIPSSQTTPCDEVHQESPSMLHRPIVAVNTPPKSPNSKDVCFRCKESGHGVRDCPKQPPRNSPCFKCGMAGHWKSNCPQL